MEHDIVEMRSSLDKERTNLAAAVVRGASASLNGLQLKPQELVKLLAKLIKHSKEITATILKESTSGYVYDDDYNKQQHLCIAYSNVDLATKASTQLCFQHADAEIRGQILSCCQNHLYASMYYLGVLFLDTKACLDLGNLKSWRAEQALATIVNALDILAYIYISSRSTKTSDSVLRHGELAEKTNEILQVINRSVNRLEPHGISLPQSKAIIFRIVASINILNRLVVQQECIQIAPCETYVILNLIGKKLGILEAQLETINKASTTDYPNTLLVSIGYAALSYYEIVTDAALRTRYALTPPHHKSSSLAFSLIKSMSLAFEIQILSSGSENAINNKKRGAASKGTPQEVCDKVHAAITAYSRQIQLQEKCTYASYAYGTVLDCIESALQSVQTLRARTDVNSVVVVEHLQMLEKSLTESEKLCASILRNKATYVEKNSCPSSILDSDASILACFCSFNKETFNYTASIDEEIGLRGWEGGGGREEAPPRAGCCTHTTINPAPSLHSFHR